MPMTISGSDALVMQEPRLQASDRRTRHPQAKLLSTASITSITPSQVYSRYQVKVSA